jgi:hypothetical protein
MPVLHVGSWVFQQRAQHLHAPRSRQNAARGYYEIDAPTISSLQAVQHRTVQYGKIQYALSSYLFPLQSFARFVPKNTGGGGYPPLQLRRYLLFCNAVHSSAFPLRTRRKYHRKVFPT